MPPPVSITPWRSRPERLGWTDWLLLAETVGTLALSSAALGLQPFKRVVAATSRPPARQAERKVDLERMRWAIDAVGRRVPWRTMCIEKALAFQLMLRRRGTSSILHYGITREGESSIKAHVWLSVDGMIVVGGEVASDFTRVASFPAGAPD